jgi:ferredoxin
MNKLEPVGVGIRALQPTPYSPSAGFFLEIEMDTKVCSKCGIRKPVAEFSKSSKNKDGLRYFCKSCISVCSQKYYQDHKDDINTKTRLYRQNHRNEQSVASRKYYDTHREAKLKSCKEYRSANREAISIKNKEYATKYPERIKAKEAVRRAIEVGILIRPDRCEKCNKIRRVVGHHESYLEEHWLDVNWWCYSCHKTYHSALATISAEEEAAND